MTIRDETNTFEASGTPGISAGATAGISLGATAGVSHVGTAVLSYAELCRLVNAVIWPGFSGRTVPQWLSSALRQGLAGVVYFSQNIDPADPAQVARLSVLVRQANPLAVIGCDEEGGNVTRLESGPGSSIPGAGVLGRIDDTSVTEAAGRAIGEMCRNAGINLVLAPVADVNTNPLNPVIGVRSFGERPGLAGRHTAAMVTGIQSAGVGACAKHFPGHGDTSTDSHLELPALRQPLNEIMAEHLPPFHDAVTAGVKSVMTAHIVIPELGPAPATLNPAAGSLLRGLGFEGLQITDALDMAAIRATTGSGRGAVLAMLAGADLLCLGNPATSGERDSNATRNATDGDDGDGTGTATGAIRPDEAAYLEVRDALLAAVADGTLPVELLRDAGRRVAEFACWAMDASAAASAIPALPAPDWVAAAAGACSFSHPARGTAETATGPAAVAGTDPGQPVALPPGTTGVLLVDARRGHNQAAGRTADLFAAGLADYVAVERLPASDLPGAGRRHPNHGTPAPGKPVVVLVGSLAAGSPGLAAAEAARDIPGAVCINTGVAVVPDPPLPTLNCFGSSRATARAVARILCTHLPG
ncbi:hydrolase [Arthrobacter sp. NicSoilB4]|uniref:glycoside hydrolase family 3 protein n=1 Tax=Arthrobacter sp. NicSoilB4 TaxID=2830997 RepID=UPI001CC54B06|nr:glycoside hydrolase family 3 N-terminal domain-containing protein [Arthrobacter sp. NicSoilB4]BCW66121.1 hydrolase [Arthrobacter sp. NicSoilB4]